MYVMVRKVHVCCQVHGQGYKREGIMYKYIGPFSLELDNNGTYTQDIFFLAVVGHKVHNLEGDI